MNTYALVKTGPLCLECVRCLGCIIRDALENPVIDNENEKGRKKKHRCMYTGHTHMGLGCQRRENIGFR